MLFCQEPTVRVYARTGWRQIDRTRVTRVDRGAECPLPEGSMAMVYSIGGREFPDGPIHLAGNDW